MASSIFSGDFHIKVGVINAFDLNASHLLILFVRNAQIGGEENSTQG